MYILLHDVRDTLTRNVLETNFAGMNEMIGSPRCHVQIWIVLVHEAIVNVTCINVTY